MPRSRRRCSNAASRCSSRSRWLVRCARLTRSWRSPLAPGTILAVGHTERFNPAVEAARAHLKTPRFVEVHRLGTFPERSLDIDVVFDLMIHDLDLVLSIVGSRGHVHRRGGRAGADAEDRHCERAAAVRERMHREPDRQPDQPRTRAEDPVLPARLVRRRSTTRRRSSRSGASSARGRGCPRLKEASSRS